MLRLTLIVFVLAGCGDSLPAKTAPKPKAAAPTGWSKAAPASVNTLPPAIRAPSTLPPRAARADNTACADCHPDQAESFAKTGMGRSMVTLPGAAVIEDFENATITHAPSGLIYTAVRDAEGRYWQEERHPSHPSVRRIQATHIIGSGNHTRSYLGMRDGELVQLPLTWYTGRKIWDLSPGYERAGMPRFSRRVQAPCLFCHNGLTPLVEGRAATYQWPLAEGIGCDRCHGDGGAHVKARTAGIGPPAGQADPSIFNPKRHTPERQLQVCQQCHLQAAASVVHRGHRWDAYDPRLPLEDYMSVFRKVGKDGVEFSIASQGRRLALSQCAIVSKATPGGSQLGCTTCHNPHDTATDATYRQACLGCHQPGAEPATATLRKGCSEAAGQQPAALCHTCHMRSGGTSDVPHVQFIDHFIRRQPTADRPTPAPGLALEDLVAGAAPPDAWLLGIAHTHLWERMWQPEHLPEAVRTLSVALQATPNDLRAIQALGRALVKVKQHDRAEVLFKQAIDLGGRSERLLLDRASNAWAAGQMMVAKTAYEAAVKAYPGGVAWLDLGRVRQRLKDMPGAIAAFAEAAKYEGIRAKALAQLGAIALQQGKPIAAKMNLTMAREADPIYLPAILWQSTIAMDAGKPAEALPLLDSVIAQDPKAYPAYGLRAQVYVALKQFDGALADFERLLTATPDQLQPWLMYINTAIQAGRVDLAQAKLALAMERFPGNAQLMQAAQGVRSPPR